MTTKSPGSVPGITSAANTTAVMNAASSAGVSRCPGSVGLASGGSSDLSSASSAGGGDSLRAACWFASSTLSLPLAQCRRGTRRCGQTCAASLRKLTCAIACASQDYAARQWRRAWRPYHLCGRLQARACASAWRLKQVHPRPTASQRALPCQLQSILVRDQSPPDEPASGSTAKRSSSCAHVTLPRLPKGGRANQKDAAEGHTAVHGCRCGLRHRAPRRGLSAATLPLQGREG